MALNANKAGNNLPRAEALEPENYMARLVQVIDLGVQAQRPFQGKEKPPAQEIMLTYELATEFMKDDEGEDDETRPRWLSERIPLFNLKSERAKSTKRYLALDPKQAHKGDFSKLVGLPCLVAVVNNERDGRVYNNVGGITQPLKGIPVPELKNEPVVFDLDDPDLDTFLSFPEWVQGVIKDGLNFRGSKLDKLLGGEDEPEVVDVNDDVDDVDEDFPV